MKDVSFTIPNTEGALEFFSGLFGYFELSATADESDDGKQIEIEIPAACIREFNREQGG